MSSNEEIVRLGNVRKQIRENSFKHKNFNPFLESKTHKRYYSGIYKKNLHLNSDQKGSIDLEDKTNVLDILVPVHTEYANFNVFAPRKNKWLNKSLGKQQNMNEND